LGSFSRKIHSALEVHEEEHLTERKKKYCQLHGVRPLTNTSYEKLYFICQLQPLEWLEILSQGSKVHDYGRNHQNLPNDPIASILIPSTMHPTLTFSQKLTNT
jgi:hypothetical protein